MVVLFGVAWKIVKGTKKGSWKPLWQELFQSFKNVIPDDWQVIVSADRGLYADWLFEAICDLNWHPFLRINHQGTYQIQGEKQWKSLNQVVEKTAMSWSGLVTCFKTNPLDCTLLARWDKGYQDPWLIVTDLEATQADVRWYGLRSWIECGYRDVKSDGWQWHKTRLREPARAERIWLAMAVATLWAVTMGDEQTQHLRETFTQKQTTMENSQDHCQSKSNPTHRQISYFLQGVINIVARLISGQSICLDNLFPQSPLLFNSS